MKKDWVITILVIVFVLLISFLILNKPTQKTEKEIIQCIGKRATLYAQERCPHCKVQEQLFGENFKYLKVVWCDKDWIKCQNIKGTPAWEINGKFILGVQSIEKLQELTGC